MSNLRGTGYLCKAVYASNPGGKSHGVIFDRWLAGSPGQGEIIQTENGRYSTVWSGTHKDNPSLGKSYVHWWPDQSRFYSQDDWRFLLGYDHGTAAPAWCGIFAEAKQTTRGDLDMATRRSSPTSEHRRASETSSSVTACYSSRGKKVTMSQISLLSKLPVWPNYRTRLQRYL